MFDTLRQLKNLREQAQAMQTALKAERVTGTGAQDRVTVVLDGTHAVHEVRIDPALCTPDQREVLERGISDAFESARSQIQGRMAQRLREGGMSLPGLS